MENNQNERKRISEIEGLLSPVIMRAGLFIECKADKTRYLNPLSMVETYNTVHGTEDYQN